MEPDSEGRVRLCHGLHSDCLIRSVGSRMRRPHLHSPHERRSDRLPFQSPQPHSPPSLDLSASFPVSFASVKTFHSRSLQNATMSVPRPEVVLRGHCSVIFDNILYTYQPEALQSIALEEGAEWDRLPMGVPVSGAVCVLAVPDGDKSRAALYVVGGRTDEEDIDYPGLQRYVFANREWETISPVVTVTQNRVNHAATYLNESNSIFVYAGLQADGRSGPSSQTFVISTEPPFRVQAFPSRAPPVVSPMLLPWDEAQAVMLGGDPDNRKLFTFAPATAWNELPVELPSGFQNPDSVSATIIRGEDGSRVLEIFDMGTSPNEVTQILVRAPDGQSAELGQPVGRKRKRDLTLADWPSYNETFAPTALRSGFSLASGADGLDVISGGNEDVPLCIFDQLENSWVNGTALFVGQEANIDSLSPSSSLSPDSSATDISGSSTESASAESDSSRDEMLTILGITLGGVFGVAVLLAVILVLFRWRKERSKRLAVKAMKEKDDRLSFADRGGPMMDQPGLPPVIDPYSKPPIPSPYNDPFSSPPQPLPVIPPVNRSLSPNDGQHKRGGGELGSDANSMTGLLFKPAPMGDADRSAPGSRGLHDAPYLGTSDRMVARTEPAPPPAVADPSPRLPNDGFQFAHQERQQPQDTPSDRGRSSGWSKYFTNNEATTNLVSAPANRGTYASSQSRSSTTSQNAFSDPQKAAAAANAEHDPPKLDTHYVMMRNPTVGTGQAIRPPQKAELAHHDSMSSTSTDRDDDYYGNDYRYNDRDLRKKSFLDEASTNDDGKSMVTKKSGDTDSAGTKARPSSSVYAPNGLPPYPPEPHPGVPSSIYPRQPASSVYPKSMGYNSFYNPQALADGVVVNNSEPMPGSNNETQSGLPPTKPDNAASAVDDAIKEPGATRRRRGTSNDMSWLNLGINPQ